MDLEEGLLDEIEPSVAGPREMAAQLRRQARVEVLESLESTCLVVDHQGDEIVHTSSSLVEAKSLHRSVGFVRFETPIADSRK
jgi:hypothetical protein